MAGKHFTPSVASKNDQLAKGSSFQFFKRGAEAVTD